MINDGQKQHGFVQCVFFSRCYASFIICWVAKKITFITFNKEATMAMEMEKKKNQDLLQSGITLTSSNDKNSQQLLKLRPLTRIPEISWSKSLHSFIGLKEKPKINQMIKFPGGIRNNYYELSLSFNHIVNYVSIFSKWNFLECNSKLFQRAWNLLTHNLVSNLFLSTPQCRWDWKWTEICWKSLILSYLQKLFTNCFLTWTKSIIHLKLLYVISLWGNAWLPSKAENGEWEGCGFYGLNSVETTNIRCI